MNREGDETRKKEWDRVSALPESELGTVSGQVVSALDLRNQIKPSKGAAAATWLP